MAPASKPVDETTYSGRFAARLRMLREKAGLTVPQVTELLRKEGVTIADRSYYSWEAGRSMPHFDLLPSIAIVLKQSSPRNLFPSK